MPRVLLVEDDASMLSLLTTLLQIEGFEVLYLEDDDSEETILESICRLRPDLVMMDVYLRRANGLDVLRRLRAITECKDMRVLVSSGMDYSVECRQAGADSFILKPYMPDDLLTQVHQLVSHVQ
jgi:DNA-binding response OmpR family regulator